VPDNPARGKAQGRIDARSRGSRIGPNTGVKPRSRSLAHPAIDLA
jgi:hypothetical protein